MLLRMRQVANCNNGPHAEEGRASGPLEARTAHISEEMEANMKDEGYGLRLIGHDLLQGYGGVGEGMSLQKAHDGRRIMWLAHEGPPTNFTGVDVSDPKKPKVVVQTQLPHGRVRSNSLEVVGDIMAVAAQTHQARWHPAGLPMWGHGEFGE